MKRYLVVVLAPNKEIKASLVQPDLGRALVTADAYSNKPYVILSGSVNMLLHAREALNVPSQSWMTTQMFLKHVLSVAKLYNFKDEVICNITQWDLSKVKKN